MCGDRSCALSPRKWRGADGRGPQDAAQLAVGHAQEPQRLERGADRRNALAAALGAQERTGLTVARGAARGLYPRPRAQHHRASRTGFACLDHLGASVQTGALQEAGNHDQGPLRCGRARHARPPKQRLRRVDERAASVGQARSARIPHSPQLHHHGLPAAVTLEAPAGTPVRRRRGRQTRMLRYTLNGT